MDVVVSGATMTGDHLTGCFCFCSLPPVTPGVVELTVVKICIVVKVHCKHENM